MNWLKDFFFCDTWGDLVIAAILGAIGFIVFWAVLFFVFALFG